MSEFFTKDEVEYLESIGFEIRGYTKQGVLDMLHDFEDGARMATYKSQDRYILLYYPAETSDQFGDRVKQTFTKFEDMVDFMEA